MKKIIIFIIITLPLLIFINKIIIPYMTPSESLATKMLKNGQKLYGARCASCHGIKANGNTVYPKIDTSTNKNTLFLQIQNHKTGALGINTSIEMKYNNSNLNKDDLDDIITYLHSIQYK